MPNKTCCAAWIVFLTAAPASLHADDNADYADLSRRIHQAIAPQIPKQFEDRSEWGGTVPIPERLRLAGLRTRVKVGDKEEFPHGAWKRTFIWLDDPTKDVQIDVRELRKLEGGPFRLVLDATVALHGERERQQWQRGLKLLAITAQADAVVTIGLEFDVKIALDLAKLPPEVNVEPKVVQSRLLLKEFELRKVGRLIEGDLALQIGDELKGVIQDQMRQREPQVKERANQAIAKALQEGKGKISATSLLKAQGPAKPKE
jgi:hypothetical protein